MVRLVSRNRQQTLKHRPIQLLYPLEIRDTQGDSGIGSANGSVTHDPESQTSSQYTPTESLTQQDEGARRRTKHIAANQRDDWKRAFILLLDV